MKELYLITGFLGAGKTTFVNMAVRAFAGRRIAVIVNEFGKQGVDGGLLSGKGYEVTEISNGSVFCVCRMDMFIDALIQAAKADIDLLIVETSGLSNPTNIDDILGQTKTVSGESFDYKGCICMADAVNFEKVYATAVVIPDQIKQASLVIINKTDLASEEKIKKAENIIMSLNPACEIYRTVYADVPKRLLTDLEPVSDRILGGKQDLLSGSLTFKILNKPDADTFGKLIDGIKSVIYRCKGYAALAGGDYFIDGVMDDISFSRTEKEHQSGIVVLYKTSGQVKNALRKAAEENNIEIEIN
jgi:G3E family GTPase